MEIRHLEMFVALADALHFGQAAQRLGCTQPALSRAIQRLESDLGVQLFERDSRNVRLTDAGLAFQVGARDLVDKAAEAERIARSAGGAYLGGLVLGVGLCGQFPAVGALVRTFRDLHPAVSVSLVSVDEPAIPRALADEAVHALVSVDWALPAGCHSRPLFETELAAILPAEHPLADKPWIEPSALDGLRLVMPCRRQQPMIAQHFQELCNREQIKPVLDLEVQTFDQTLGLVAGGAAAGLLPVPKDLRYPGVAVRPFRPKYRLKYRIGWRKVSKLTEALDAALDRMARPADESA